MGQARAGRGSSAVSSPHFKGGHVRIESLRLDALQVRLPHGRSGQGSGNQVAGIPCYQGEFTRTNGLRSEVIYLRPAHGTSKGRERERCRHSFYHKVDVARTESVLLEDL